MSPRVNLSRISSHDLLVAARLAIVTYSPDGRTDELAGLLFGQYSFFEATTKNHIFGNAPAAWASELQEAVDLKRQGQYLRAAQVLTSLMLDAQTVYTQATDILFEIEACSGLIKAADQRLCGLIQKLDMAALTHLVPAYEAKLRDLVAAFESEKSLETYLAGLCGNPDYVLPKTFQELRADIDEMIADEMYGTFHEKALQRSSEWVTLSIQPDGRMLTPPTSNSTYLPDDKFDELRALTKSFLGEFDETLKKGLATSSSSHPEAWEHQVSRAVELKRRGQFLESAKIYVDLCRDGGTVYTSILNGLYKTVATAGDLLNANFILMRGQNIYRLNPHGPSVDAGIGSNFADHLSRLIAATESRERLEDYLRSISGNPRYYPPRDYTVMVTELQEHYSQIAQKFAEIEKMQKRANGGCYIATAVYGSYDAPPVLTLRQYRDDTLAHSRLGRSLIRVYYKVSPPLARRLFPGGIPASATRLLLDQLVRRLDGHSSDRAM